MNSTLTAETQTEPSPEEIARMQAEMHEMYLEAERAFARMDANSVEIDRLRAETRVILDSLALHKWTTQEERDREKMEQAQQLAEKDREIAERDHELLLSRLETKLLSYERRLPPPESSENIL